ncbi:MFS transporter [Streptomyces sp. PA5.6]|uniref:MFS transporter n=1 Tax=Streptomyces sp. PA5.6 TaxID=3035651 RepID=UPI0039048B07
MSRASTPAARPKPSESAEPAERSPHLLGGYRALARLPHFWRLSAIAVTSKLAASMSGLSLLLLVSSASSYGTAGLAVSCSTLGQGLTAPLRGRLVDRYRVRPVLAGCLTAHLIATLAVLLAAHDGSDGSGAGSAPLICALAAAVGATAPPVAVMTRSAWHGVASGAALDTAMALDASLMGAALIVGPVLAGWLGLSVSPLLPYAVITALTVVSVALVMASAGTLAPPPTGTAAASRARIWSSSPLRRLLIADGLFVMAVTAVDVVLPIYARQAHATELTGLYLGSLAVGSVVGSFTLGTFTRRLRRERGRVLPVLLLLFAVGCAALAAAVRLSPTVVLLVCPVAGLVIGSLFAVLRTTGGDLAPAGQVTETMSWLSSLDMAGGAAGAAVFAQLAGAWGSREALMCVPAIILVAAAASWRILGRKRC